MAGRGWREVQIGELAEVFDGPHATPQKTNEGPVFLGISNLANGRIDLANAEHLSEEDYLRWTRRVAPKEGDVVFSYETRLGEAARILPGLRCCLGRRMGLLRPRNGKIDGRFLLYAYLGPQFQETLRAHTVHGSTVDRIPLIDMPEFPIEVPESISEQRAIAHILGTLDDKIELNHRMNETLEGIARALFKSWFVDFDPVRAKAEGRDPSLPKHLAELFPDSFEESELGEIPAGWRVAVLKELTETMLGGDWGADQPGGVETEMALCIRGADIPDLQSGGRGKMPLRYLKATSLAKRRLECGDLVIEVSGGSPTQSTGRPVLVSEALLSRLAYPLVCSNFCRFLKLKLRSASTFVYYWLRKLYDEGVLLQYESGTTGIKNFAVSLFSEKHSLVVPPVRVLDSFALFIASLRDRQQKHGSEIDTLASIRDTLLPKLISGELRVQEAKRFVEKAL